MTNIHPLLRPKRSELFRTFFWTAIISNGFLTMGAVAAMAANGDDMKPFTALLILGALVFLYFLPSVVAASRSHHNAAAIFLLNLLLGWTLIGWVAALVWSATSRPPANIINIDRRDM